MLPIANSHTNVNQKNPNTSSTKEDSTLLTNIHPDLIHILHKYAYIFTIPTQLPPSHPHDHHIHLIPNSNPINLKPYHYPYYWPTLARLAANFYWPNMHRDFQEYVAKCATCSYHKYSTQKPYGLLHPLDTPHQVWEDISMDFITNIPSSANRTVIWVVVDQLSKFAHFIPLTRVDFVVFFVFVD